MFHDSTGRAGAVQRREPDRLPEDPRAQRLLLRERGLRLSDGQHPDGRQVAGGDVPRREAGRDEVRAQWTLERDRRATPSTSGSPPRTCRTQTTGPPSDRTASSPELHRDEPHRDEAAVRTSSSRCSAASACTPATCSPPRVHEERHPGGRLRAPGRHLPLRHRPRQLGARPATARRTSSTTSTSSTRASFPASAPSTRPSPRWPTPSASATTCSSGSGLSRR